MHFETHLLVGWHLSQASGLDRTGRVLVTLASVAPDVDALPLLFGQQWYQALHHTFGHCLLFGVILAGFVAWRQPGKRRRAFLFAGAVFLLHLGADLVGTRWALWVLWPFDRTFYLDLSWGWPLWDWRNRVVAIGLLLGVLPSMRCWGRSPLELLNRRLDRMLMAWLRPSLRPGTDCGCGKAALGHCVDCGRALCLRCTRLNRSLAPRCAPCLGEGLPSSD